jgi:GNAT superfamily N-acetyltransferase
LVDIRPLSPENLNQFFEFMEGPAFETVPRWAGCYCQHYLNTEEQNSSKDNNRALTCERVENGKMTGYLAFEGEEVIGWVAANRGNNFIQLPPTNDESARILCFVVAPNHQGEGVSTKLLEFALKDLKALGFKSVEAAPRSGDEFDITAYRGKLSTFLKHGFEVMQQFDERSVLVHREL